MQTDILNHQFGRLLVLSKKQNNFYSCQCACGNFKDIRKDHLLNGDTTSCGCLRSESSSERLGRFNNVHGQRSHELYYTWSSMIARCTNENHPKFKDYGERGIKVCE